MVTINEAARNRFGDMSMALCEAEAIISAKDKEIAELLAELKRLREASSPVEPAQQMLAER
jgi:hypothetical protein